MKQKTVTNKICARGVGRDSERTIHITIIPAAENTGIVFRRIDLDEPVEIEATIENSQVVEDQLVFMDRGQQVSNSEHLLAACYGAGIHNLYVEIDGDELPKMTENAAAYVFLLQAAGIREQHAFRPQVKVTKPILNREKGGWIRVTDFDGLRIGCVNTLTEDSVSVQRSSAVVDISEATFISELCYAQSGPATIVDEQVNKTALRNKQRLAQRSQLNHMVVEVMAFLYLTGAHVEACYTSFDASVSLHLEAVRAIRSAISSEIDGVEELVALRVQ